jgi:hypothetical protein
MKTVDLTSCDFSWGGGRILPPFQCLGPHVVGWLPLGGSFSCTDEFDVVTFPDTARTQELMDEGGRRGSVYTIWCVSPKITMHRPDKLYLI